METSSTLEAIPEHNKHHRPRRSAAQRRAQHARAELRTIQRVLRAIDCMEHRGCQATRIGAALGTALRLNESHQSSTHTQTHKMPACRHYLLGRCTWGSACKFSHATVPTCPIGGEQAAQRLHSAIPEAWSGLEVTGPNLLVPHNDTTSPPEAWSGLDGTGSAMEQSTEQSAMEQSVVESAMEKNAMEPSAVESTKVPSKEQSAMEQSVVESAREPSTEQSAMEQSAVESAAEQSAMETSVVESALEQSMEQSAMVQSAMESHGVMPDWNTDGIPFRNSSVSSEGEPPQPQPPTHRTDEQFNQEIWRTGQQVFNEFGREMNMRQFRERVETSLGLQTNDLWPRREELKLVAIELLRLSQT